MFISEGPIVGYRTVIQRGDGGTPIETFTNIGFITDISGPEVMLETVDSTHIKSPNRVSTILPAVSTIGDLKLTFEFDPKDSEHNGLINDSLDKIRRNFRLIFPDGYQAQENDSALNTIWSFSGYVTQFRTSIKPDDVVIGTLSIAVDGELEITT